MSKIALVKDLTKPKVAATAKVNTDAENYRLQFITPGDGQMMSYQEGRAEADEVIARRAEDPGWIPDPNEFPLLAASVGIEKNPATGQDVQSVIEMAMIISEIFWSWKFLEHGIKRKRQAALRAIDEATVHAEVIAAQNVDWNDG